MSEEGVSRPVAGALVRAWGAEGGKIGGKSRMSKLTREQRRALAKKAAVEKELVMVFKVVTLFPIRPARVDGVGEAGMRDEPQAWTLRGSLPQHLAVLLAVSLCCVAVERLPLLFSRLLPG